MTCTKCGGLVVNDGEEEKCFNCGRRPTEQTAKIEQVKAMSHEADEQAEKPGGRRGGWTPERRAKFLATMRKKRRGGTTNAVVPVKPKAVVARPSGKGDSVVDALGLLDAALGELRDDMRALERAKEILSR